MMFGYIQIDKPELKVREFATFKAYYCGLCHSLRAYSQIARSTLTYDCAFLYLFIDALSDTPCEFEKKRCVYHAGKKEMTAKGQGADYAAAINVLLAYHKFKDNYADEHKITSLAGTAIFKNAYKKAANYLPNAAAVVEKRLGQLASIEKAKTADVDAPADVFGKMMGEILNNAMLEPSTIVYNLGYNVGRWLYLIDALDDIKKDEKTGNYNPFILCGTQNAKYNLYVNLENISKAYDLLEIKKHKGILDNILLSGLYKKTAEILRKEQLDGSI